MEIDIILALCAILIIITKCDAEDAGKLKELCQCLSDDSRIVTFPGCGKETTWSQCDIQNSCTNFPWATEESGAPENYELIENGGLLIVQALRGRDDRIYKCEEDNTTVTTYNLTLYEKCYCRPNKVAPLTMNLTLQNMPGERRTLTCSAIIGPCAIGSQCLDPQANVEWSFVTSSDRNVVTDMDYVRGSGITETKRNYREDAGGISIISTYTIESVAESDYGTYMCNISNIGGYEVIPIVLKYGESGIILPAPVFWTILTIGVLMASILSMVLGLFVYYHILWVRVFYHLWFAKDEIGDYDYDGTIICTDSVADVAFVQHLLTKAEGEMRFRLAFCGRDFYVGSDDASYVEYMSKSRRLIILISPDFLVEPSTCNRAFINALGQNRWGDMIFILLPDIDPKSWTERNCVLKSTIDQCSDKPWARIQKLNWDVKRKFCCFDLSTWEERTFWERFLLAMPKARKENEKAEAAADNNLILVKI